MFGIKAGKWVTFIAKPNIEARADKIKFEVSTNTCES
jgi:hypothetical protein